MYKILGSTCDGTLGLSPFYVWAPGQLFSGFRGEYRKRNRKNSAVTLPPESCSRYVHGLGVTPSFRYSGRPGLSICCGPDPTDSRFRSACREELSVVYCSRYRTMSAALVHGRKYRQSQAPGAHGHAKRHFYDRCGTVMGLKTQYAQSGYRHPLGGSNINRPTTH